MSEQDNINTVRRLFENLNNHNISPSLNYFSDDFRGTAPGAMSEQNRQQSQDYTQRFVDAFPDLHFDLRDVIAQGDKVAVTWTARGTHKAPLRTPTGDTIPATNRPATTPGSTVLEFHNGKIVRQDIYWDMVTMLSQLGLMATQGTSSSSTSRR